MNDTIIVSVLVGSVGIFAYVLFKYKKLHTEYEELKNITSSKEAESIRLREQNFILNDTLDKVKTLEEQLKQQQDELSIIKSESSKYKAALDGQIEKHVEMKDSYEKRVEELKQDLEVLKTSNTNYNEEIKVSKSLISELETKVNEEKRSGAKLLAEKENYIIELKKEIETLKDERKELQDQAKIDKSLVSQLQTQLDEKEKLLNDSEAKLKEQFKNLATEILENNSKKFSDQNKKSLGDILIPMQQQLTDFKKKVEDVYDKESKDRSALQNELKTLKELNQKMSTEAHNLTNALKSDSKKQGKWGEMVLEKVLESSGLREGHEYKREVSLKDDENKLFRPDVVVYLPDNRHIIVDAKTSLTAYNEYMSEENEEIKQAHLKNHLKSMKEHIKGLANKKYEDLQNVNSLDFIFMFVPIESALLLALENDVNLYDDAFKQKIILVSPTTLLVALRAVENTWRYERQAQSIADVYKRAEELYKKFNGFIEDLTKVGKSIKQADKTYDEAFKKLSTGHGNLINQVEMLKKVSNIKPKKELDNLLVENAMSEADNLEN